MNDAVPTTALSQGEVLIRCDDLAPTLRFFTEDLGFRVETIFPADEPKVASLSGHGLRLRGLCPKYQHRDHEQAAAQLDSPCPS